MGFLLPPGTYFRLTLSHVTGTKWHSVAATPQCNAISFRLEIEPHDTSGSGVVR